MRQQLQTIQLQRPIQSLQKIEILSFETLKNTLGLAVSVIGVEHFMSAGLSSPWSVAKFAETQEDKNQVWHYFREAASASMIFGGVISWMLKSWYPVIGSGLTVAYYYKLYKDALEKAPSGYPAYPISKQWIPLTEEEMQRINNILDNYDHYISPNIQKNYVKN